MDDVLKDQQPTIYKLFTKLVAKGSLQHAYLFEGALGTGKKKTARWIAKMLYCDCLNDSKVPCEVCADCQRIDSNEHPDVIELAPQGEVVKSIKVDQVRMLKNELNMSGMESQGKVVIVEDADQMTISSSNSLLKFLEEPNSKVHIFLLTTSRHNLLPTIVSRCQLIAFQSQDPSIRAQQLHTLGVSTQLASILSRITQSNEMALEYSKDEDKLNLVELSWRWFKLLVKKDPLAFIFVEENIKKKVQNKESQMFFFELIIILYQDLLKVSYQPNSQDIAFISHQEELASYSQNITSERIANSLEEILQAQNMLKANVSAQASFEYITLNLCF